MHFSLLPGQVLKDTLESDLHIYRMNILQSGILGCEATVSYSKLSQC